MWLSTDAKTGEEIEEMSDVFPPSIIVSQVLILFCCPIYVSYSSINLFKMAFSLQSGPALLPVSCRQTSQKLNPDKISLNSTRHNSDHKENVSFLRL